jgi:hypothetical protein
VGPSQLWTKRQAELCAGFSTELGPAYTVFGVDELEAKKCTQALSGKQKDRRSWPRLALGVLGHVLVEREPLGVGAFGEPYVHRQNQPLGLRAGYNLNQATASSRSRWLKQIRLEFLRYKAQVTHERAQLDEINRLRMLTLAQCAQRDPEQWLQ